MSEAWALTVALCWNKASLGIVTVFVGLLVLVELASTTEMI
tara:strand:- start:1295 stop:1417 length:123 start_codon:yes stop_codon:yes gene_type:complete